MYNYHAEVVSLLYGVGIGLTRDHLTLEAIKVIEKVDEVIVPGKMAYEIVKDIREPRVVEFPMGKSEDVVKNLAKDIADRANEEIAFCCIGDPVFYSTFHHLVEELRKIGPVSSYLEFPPPPSNVGYFYNPKVSFLRNW